MSLLLPFFKEYGEGNSYPLWYPGLENSTDCTVSPRGHQESDMTERLSLFTFKWIRIF